MKVLLDANVIVDILGATDEVLSSLQALDIMLIRRHRPCIPVSTIPIIEYVLGSRGMLGKPERLEALEDITSLLEVLDVTEADYRQALADPLKDFEDAMIAWAAHRHRVDLIVTRNTKDFTGSPVAVMTPDRYCESYRPDGYIYDLIDLG